jgi:hypothetical protein
MACQSIVAMPSCCSIFPSNAFNVPGSYPPFSHDRIILSLPALVLLANWPGVIAPAVGRRARTLHRLPHGAPRGKGTIMETKISEWTNQLTKRINEWMLEAACDVWRQIPTTLRLTGMWLRMPETTSLGMGGRDWQKASGTASEGRGEHSGAGVDGPCVPARPSRPKRK